MSDRPTGGDVPLDQEIESALLGMNLQEVDLPPARGRRDGKPGDKQARDVDLKRGAVVGINGDDVIVDMGPRMQGVAKLSEFSERPAEGQEFEFTLRGQEDGLWILSRKDAVALASWKEMEPGNLVKARVTGQNTGGLELKVGPISAFMPASHVDLKRVEDFSSLLGETLLCEVLEVDMSKKRVLLSRRAVLAREREEARESGMATLTPGQVVRGKVSRIETFGAFVEIAPGVEGLLHVSNISRKRVEDPNDVLKVGEQLEVMVLEIKEGGKRIGLGRKQLEANPWDDLAHRLATDSTVTGRVVRNVEFGAFIEIEPGVEGLLHISQLGVDRVRRVSDVLKVGEEVAVRVVSIEPDRERLSLSRLDPHGAVLGSEDAVDSGYLAQELERSQDTRIGTNLGALFKKAKKD